MASQLITIGIVSLALTSAIRGGDDLTNIPLDCHVSKQLTVFWLYFGKKQWVFKSLNYYFLLFPAHSSILAVLIAAAGLQPACPADPAIAS